MYQCYDESWTYNDLDYEAQSTMDNIWIMEWIENHEG